MTASQSRIGVSRPNLDLDLDWTSFPLEKFSYVTSPVGSGNLPWVHDIRKDALVLVFRTVRVLHDSDEYESRLVMSVAVGPDTLERVDVGELLGEAQAHDERSRIRNADARSDPPVQVVVKSPCIAMRYPLSRTNIRRIQMRYKNESDYKRAFEIFNKIGLPVKNAAANFAVSTTGFSTRSLSVVPQLQPRPGEINCLGPSRRSCETRTPLPSFPTPVSLNTRLEMATKSPFFDRPHSTTSETIRPGDAWSLNGDKIVRPSTGLSSSSTIFKFKPRDWPIPSASYASPFASNYNQLDPGFATKSVSLNEQAARPASPQFISQISDGYFFPKSTLPDARTPSETYNNGQHLQSLSSDVAMRRSTTADPEPIESLLKGGLDRRISLQFESTRPKSTPVAYDPSAHNLWIPPKRDLPFPKPRVKSLLSAAGRSPNLQQSPPSVNSRHADVVHHIVKETPIPLPKSVAKPTAKGASLQKSLPISRTSAQKIDGEIKAPTRRSEGDFQMDYAEEMSPLAAKSAAKSAAIAGPVTAPSLPSKAIFTTSRKRGSNFKDTPVPSKVAKIMVDRSTQTQTVSGRDHTVPVIAPSVQDRSLSRASGSSRPPSPLARYMDEIDAFVSKHKYRPAPVEVWQRPGYAEATEDERQAELTNFICENLDNEDFIKLCEDVGNVWQRIGLE